MRIIGITGGIGSGKSTVSGHLAKRGLSLIDADSIAHELSEKGSPLLEGLAGSFGSDILFPDGSLNRKRLAERAFSSEESKAELDRLTHGEIKKRIFYLLEEAKRREAETGKGETVLLDAPLLFECDLNELCDEVWLVSADESLRIERAARRDGGGTADAGRRNSFQLSEEEKRKRADFIIENDGALTELLEKADALFEERKGIWG